MACRVTHVMCAGTSLSNDAYAAATAGFASPDVFQIFLALPFGAMSSYTASEIAAAMSHPQPSRLLSHRLLAITRRAALLPCMRQPSGTVYFVTFGGDFFLVFPLATLMNGHPKHLQQRPFAGACCSSPGRSDFYVLVKQAMAATH